MRLHGRRRWRDVGRVARRAQQDQAVPEADGVRGAPRRKGSRREDARVAAHRRQAHRTRGGGGDAGGVVRARDGKVLPVGVQEGQGLRVGLRDQRRLRAVGGATHRPRRRRRVQIRDEVPRDYPRRRRARRFHDPRQKRHLLGAFHRQVRLRGDQVPDACGAGRQDGRLEAPHDLLSVRLQDRGHDGRRA